MLLLCCNLLFSMSIKIASVSDICFPFTKYFFIALPSRLLSIQCYNQSSSECAAASVQTSFQCSLDELVEKFRSY